MEKTSASAPKKMRKLKDFSDGNKKTRLILMTISIIGGFLLWYLITLIPTINTFLVIGYLLLRMHHSQMAL